MEDKAYLDSIHRLGRISTAVAVVMLFAIPALVCWRFDCFPTFSQVITPAITIIAALGPGTVSEVFSYAPSLGSASYMAFITGNVLNLKLPVAMSAQNIVKAEPNTVKADAVSTMAIALSSIETIIIICLGVLLMAPLSPVLQAPAFQMAAGYIVPALFGGLAIGTLFRSGGKMEKKWSLCTLPLILTVIGLLLIPGFAGYQGFIIIAMIPVTIGWGYFLHKRNVVKMAAPAGK